MPSISVQIIVYRVFYELESIQKIQKLEIGNIF